MVLFISGSGKYKLRASHPDLNIEVRGSSEVNSFFLIKLSKRTFFSSAYFFSDKLLMLQVELGFGNGVIDDIFFVGGYDINGFVVSQVFLLQ